MGLELRRFADIMYMFIRKYAKVRSVADAARRAKSGIGQILKRISTDLDLIMYWMGRRRRCRCDDIRGPRKRQCGER